MKPFNPKILSSFSSDEVLLSCGFQKTKSAFFYFNELPFFDLYVKITKWAIPENIHTYTTDGF